MLVSLRCDTMNINGAVGGYRRWTGWMRFTRIYLLGIGGVYMIRVRWRGCGCTCWCVMREEIFIVARHRE